MRRAGAVGALATAALAALAAPAQADPRIDLDRCDALDRVALRRAVDAELAGLAADKRAAVDGVVIVDCPDAVTAHLQLEPAPATGPIARSLDLGEVPGALRARLVALAVVEVVELASLLGPAAKPTADRPPTDPGTTGDRPSGIDPEPLNDPSGGNAPGAGAPPRTDLAAAGVATGVTARADLTRFATRRSLGDGGGVLGGRAVSPRIGLRIYPARAVPMLDVAFDLAFGAISLGVTGAVGQADDPLGTVRPYLLAGTAGVTVACARNGAFEACVSGRLSAGLAAATASAADPTTAAATATAPYLELGGELELAWRGRRRAAVLALDVGWAEGLIATAGNREAARLAGLAIVATIGARL